MTRLVIGAAVETPLGKGTVREIRANGRLVVDIRGRALIVRDGDVRPAAPRGRRQAHPAGAGVPDGPPAAAAPSSPDVDLHGLTVHEALARADEALDAACLADRPAVRLIHGRSGGRIRAALHRHLRAIPAVRAFRLDPRNPGVTIVDL
jgi:DNA mismatch repair protein MutS2